MPGLNKQGPDGAGAMTGRQRGMCRRTESQTLANSGSGRGRGMGMGRGLGKGPNVQQGRRFNQAAAPQQSTQDAASEQLRELQEQYQAGQHALNNIEQKIAALKGGK